ncbi:hypothetical protein [Nocardia farcinica]|nr:hypothetical protein [Nocardia farcinica]MBF6250229.1 hypothetical protein [Nocardia farcinica]MBF6304641.1 hypothetical protein [Nocardia farcinica]
MSDVPIGRIHCATTVLDSRGRLGERSTLRALGWGPGRQVAIHTARHVALVTAAERGPHIVGPHGYLHLPARIRSTCHLRAQDRLLLVAALDRHQLLVYPMPVLATALYQHRQDLWDQG